MRKGVLLSVEDLTVRFHTRNGIIHAVERASFDLKKGEVLGVVGESGSGKSVMCYSLLGLIPKPPGRIHSGSANFCGTDLLKAKEWVLRHVRGLRIAMIFQDPMTALNPFLPISEQLMEPLRIHKGMNRKAAFNLAIEALEDVGIPNAEERIHSFPHEFSGGMRQRVVIAMALITRPDILICDEPTTALDVSVQKKILDLIKDRQRELGTSVIMITHDLGVVREVCDRVNVMYAGRIVESANTEQLFQSPRHAYTRALMMSIPAAHRRGERLFTIPGLPPDMTNPPRGCAFQPRNTLGDASRCIEDSMPQLNQVCEGHWVQNCPGCTASNASTSGI